jgi:hypothetical protein
LRAIADSGEKTPTTPPRRRPGKPLLVAGYFMALILPPVGLILGLVLLIRRSWHGIAVVVIAFSIITVFLVTASQGVDDEVSPGFLREANELADCVSKAPPKQSIHAQFRLCEKQLRGR